MHWLEPKIIEKDWFFSRDIWCQKCGLLNFYKETKVSKKKIFPTFKNEFCQTISLIEVVIRVRSHNPQWQWYIATRCFGPTSLTTYTPTGQMHRPRSFITKRSNNPCRALGPGKLAKLAMLAHSLWNEKRRATRDLGVLGEPKAQKWWEGERKLDEILYERKFLITNF